MKKKPHQLFWVDSSCSKLQSVHNSYTVLSISSHCAVGLAPADSSSATISSSSDGDHSETHSTDSDRTYILQETESALSSTDSYFTAETLHSSSMPATRLSSKEALMAELRELRSATPLKEVAGQMERWIATGVYSPLDSPSASGDGESGVSVCVCFVIVVVLKKTF